MSYPTISVAFAFGSTPLGDPPVWTDVSAFVRAIPLIRRSGRQWELDAFEAGEATIVLDNRDRRFDPSDTEGMYYPNLTPVRGVRIQAVYASTTYNLFRGYVTSWEQQWEPSNQDAVTIVHCTDGFRLLNQMSIYGVIGPAFVGDDINTHLDTVGWPVSWRNVPQCLGYILQTTAVGMPILQRIQDAVDVERGLFFIDGRGYAIMHPRYRRMENAASNASQATFGDGGGSELPYIEVRAETSDERVWNDVRITPAGGEYQFAYSPASAAIYLQRTYAKTLQIGDGAISAADEALGIAQYLLTIYQSSAGVFLPPFRFTTLSVRGGATNALWAHILGREISDRITIKRRPPGSVGAEPIGGPGGRDVFIEGIEHRIPVVSASFLDWTTTWSLSPAEFAEFWVLDHARWSVLGDTTRLAY